ncbi:thioesterase family protein [Mesonia sp. K7]|uniref:acyl-CoA thioesterase n=1 Tax=Mesonia sp. K7 TaxID=2218606 RepID=UPI0013149B15|nr:thioesterase family protein [Mesonia sp. K7]
MQAIPFFLSLSVEPSAIDDLNHVNNLKYVEWVQWVSQKHWEEKADKSVQEKYGWVVLNLNIDYKSPAFLGEELLLKTYILNYKGVRSERQTQIYRKADNTLLAQAKVLWCLVDKEKQRPQRITEEIVKPFFE